MLSLSSLMLSLSKYEGRVLGYSVSCESGF